MNSRFYRLPVRNIFRLNFSTTFNFQNAVKITQLVRFALSIKVFEKMDVKVGVKFRPTFKFYAALALLY